MTQRDVTVITTTSSARVVLNTLARSSGDAASRSSDIAQARAADLYWNFSSSRDRVEIKVRDHPISLDGLGSTQQDGAVQYRRKPDGNGYPRLQKPQVSKNNAYTLFGASLGVRSERGRKVNENV